MATFPVLSSGATSQYPTANGRAQAVQTIRFVDGSDQRYLFQGKVLRQWQIHLDLLSESEIQQIESFFDAIQGDNLPFTFVDPVSGVAVANCRLASPVIVSEYVGLDRCKTSLEVIETNG